MSSPDFWADQNSAKAQAKEHSTLKNLTEGWLQLEADVHDLEELSALATSEHDKALESDLNAKFRRLRASYEQFRLTTFLGGKYDQNDAIISIHAGAGGLDAQDWAGMLLRMYLRFCETKNFKTTIIDESRGSDGGIKSVVIEITGHCAYGYMKCEAGVHRLVRLSPYNPAHTRETSFALMEVLPAIEHTQFKMNMDDVEIEAKTSSGHGGQSVNTTYSAIRATHKPSGLTVTIQNERSQMQNKEQALKILAGKVAHLEEKRLEEERLKLRGEYHSAEWGNQIRSYVLHPYKMVKDHRTNHETSNAEGVLDGDLDEFVKKYLEMNKK